MEKDDVITLSWKKACQTVEKEGAREGIVAGKASIYQKCFDIGYSEGFRHGFSLGLYKSLLRFHNTTGYEDDILKKTTRGNCAICKSNDLLEKNTSELIDIQINSTKHILNVLEIQYDGNIKTEFTLT